MRLPASALLLASLPTALGITPLTTPGSEASPRKLTKSVSFDTSICIFRKSVNHYYYGLNLDLQGTGWCDKIKTGLDNTCNITPGTWDCNEPDAESGNPCGLKFASTKKEGTPCEPEKVEQTLLKVAKVRVTCSARDQGRVPVA